MPLLQPADDAPPPIATALIVPVPELERVVGKHRRALDQSAPWGVPAHVTVLFPFVEPAGIDEEVLRRLREAICPIGSFGCRFEQTQWFGDDVLWLAPNPSGPFRRLTAAVWQAFPGYPPYAGAHPDVIPHLTVAERVVGGLEAVRAAERAVQPMLPVTAAIDQVLLIAGTWSNDSWRVLHELPLGDA